METEVQCEDPPPPDGAFFGAYLSEDILYAPLDCGPLEDDAGEGLPENPYADMEAEDGLVWGGSTYLTAEEETMDPESMPRSIKRNALRGIPPSQGDEEESPMPVYEWQRRLLPAVQEAPEEGNYWEGKGFFETALGGATEAPQETA